MIGEISAFVDYFESGLSGLPSGNHIVEILAIRKISKPEIKRRPYGIILGNVSARDNLPRTQQARQPYRRSS